MYLSTGSLEEAESTAGELKRLVEQAELESEKRYYNHLKGKIEIEKRNFSLAIDYLKKALVQKPVDDTYYRAEVSIFLEYSLATAYHLFGDLEKAVEEYAKILKPYTVRFGYGLSYEDLYARTFYMIGKIYEQQGENAQVIEHYEKFLSLWKDADPGLPEVDDARKRLAGLKE